MKIESEAVTFNNSVRFNVIPTQVPQKFFASDATPTVLNHEYWIANNTGAVLITRFDDGAECQELRILGDGFTTVVHGSDIKTNTGLNKLLLTNRLYRFTYINQVWYEDAP